ncbi:putative bifunctional diguanylate cyclase/phosphodiesterase [Henriciella aquimarina]|uniref:putative bifunctional diguanylate cyclase/phosphodiesterase n=1 Tax=Henriciella aquimarina TaxID=545261 RepID=UPI0009FEFBC5|nr:GGDEF and EAL domain-containing protein [Henriciella aquimarina]
MKLADDIKSISDLQAIIDVIPLPVFVKNRAHRIVLLNEAACDFFGHSRDVLLGFSDYDLFPDEEVEVFHAADDRVFEEGVLSENEEQVTDASGRPRTVITCKRRVRLNETPFLVATITDVTAYREAEAHNHYLAFHDTLTGLPNRALLNERIDQALLRRKRSNEAGTLLYIDLDRFKEINDTHGHQAGDTLIRGFAERLTTLVRASDTVSRLGGDEFAILLNDRGQQADVDLICRRILDAAAEPFVIEEASAYVTASVGVADIVDGISNVELHRRADVALYQAKHEGKACYRRFTKALDEKIQHLRKLESDLREALATGTGLEVHYQPLFSTAGERLSGMEALVRWRHPEFGLLLPEAFIPVAEDSGLIVPMGKWVLKTACTMMADQPSLRLAVNLSPVQLRDDNMVGEILDILDETDFAASRLELELTESAIMATDQPSRDRLNRLRDAGVKVALDDFGTGYSSLTHLQKLDVDKVKIDKSFVEDIGTPGESQAIVRAVTSIARVLKIPVTAEGVENMRQHDLLRLIGCSEMQGFLYSKPLSTEDTERFLADKSRWTHVA